MILAFMKNAHRFLGSFLALVFASALPLSAQENKAAPPASPFDLQDGETLVFLGDSITHQCLYTQYLENFFYTRYPERRIRFHNAGVSGDKAADAVARFDDDVAAFQPKVVTVLLGMNDGRYEDFNSETFGTYAQDMTKLLDRIEAIGAKPIVMSPTMFDHHQLSLNMKDPEFRFRDRSFSEQYNALLAFYGGWLRERAGERGLSFADQWAPMNQHTFAQRRTEPDFTLVPDAIHPAPAGHFLMAFELLWQVKPERKSVSSIAIVPGGKGMRAKKEIADLEVSEARDRVTFSYQAPALPWVVPSQAWEGEKKWSDQPDARFGYEMTVAGHKMSNERLKIAGLAPGTYEVKIDGISVGTWSHIALGSKVELQSNEKTPQYQQALDVAELNRQRNDQALRPLRDTWSRIKGLRSSGRKAEAEGQPNNFEKEYEALKPKVAEFHQLAQDFEDRIYEAAQPKARRYEIVKVK